MKLPFVKAGVHQHVFVAILLLGFARGMMYANFMPPWGIIDEEQHLDYILRLAEDQRIPIVGKTLLSQEIIQSLFEVHRWDTFHWRTPASQSVKDMWIEIYSFEGYQPPLYYGLLAPIYALLQGTVLFKLFFLRWITVILSLVTVWIAIRWTEDLFPSQMFLPYVVGLILVLIPERTMATSRINNDVLLEVLGAAFLWQSTKAIIEGMSPSRGRWIALLLGIGILTKISMAALGIVLLLVFWQNRRRTDLIKSSFWMIGILMLLVLPFVIFNWVTYGDLTGAAGFKRLIQSAGGLQAPPLTTASLIKALSDSFSHFWVIWWKQAIVGSNPALTFLYVLLAGLTLISAVGMVFSLRSRTEDGIGRYKQIMGAYIALVGIYVFAMLVSYFGGKDGSSIPIPIIQGRFFLPVVVPIVILFSIGLYAYPRWRWHLIVILGLILLAADSLNLFGNLLRQFYFWAWFYQNGQPTAFYSPNLQHSLNLFLTRFWMDKPESIKAVIYMVLPFYFITLAGVVFAFLRAGQQPKMSGQPVTVEG